jgi:hypothetical protein
VVCRLILATANPDKAAETFVIVGAKLELVPVRRTSLKSRRTAPPSTRTPD